MVMRCGEETGPVDREEGNPASFSQKLHFPDAAGNRSDTTLRTRSLK